MMMKKVVRIYNKRDQNGYCMVEKFPDRAYMQVFEHDLNLDEGDVVRIDCPFFVQTGNYLHKEWFDGFFYVGEIEEEEEVEYITLEKLVGLSDIHSDKDIKKLEMKKSMFF
jgi:hypothetical protein